MNVIALCKFKKCVLTCEVGYAKVTVALILVLNESEGQYLPLGGVSAIFLVSSLTRGAGADNFSKGAH
jgi:hypothetical protein